MKRIFFLTGMMLLCLQLSAQFSMPPYNLADRDLKGPVKSVTTYYEDNENGMPYTKTEHFNRMGYLESQSVNGEMRSGTTHYLFDASGRLVGEEFVDFYNYKTTYEYDKRGCIVRATTVTNYVEEGEVVYDTVEYVNGDDCKPKTIKAGDIIAHLTYDGNGRLISHKADSYQVDYTYDAAGHLLSANTNRGEFVENYIYDGKGNLSEYWEVRDGIEGTHIYHKISNERDKYGNWLRRTITYSIEEETITDNVTRKIEYYSE